MIVSIDEKAEKRLKDKLKENNFNKLFNYIVLRQELKAGEYFMLAGFVYGSDAHNYADKEFNSCIIINLLYSN